jgi:hypothetical protein
MNYKKRIFFGMTVLRTSLFSVLVGSGLLSLAYANAANAYDPNSPAFYPYALSVSTGACVNGQQQVSLSWGTSASGVTYSVSRKNPGSTEWPVVIEGLSARSYTDVPGSAGTYSYQIKATNAYGVGYSSIQNVTVGTCSAVSPIIAPTTPVSSPVSVSDPAFVPYALNAPTASCAGGKPQVSLSWGTSAGGVTYSILRKSPGSTAWPIIASGLSARSYADLPGSAGTYSYQIKATNSVGVGYSSIQSVLVGACASVAAASTPAPVPAPTPTSAPVVNPSMQWGFTSGWQPESMTALSQTIGKQPDQIAVFIHFGNENQFPHYLAPTIRDTGKTMVIFWEYTDYNVASPYQPRFSYDAMLRGDWDAYMKSFAAEAKAYGGPVILIPFSEMNGNWFPWSGTLNGNSPAKMIQSYRHIHDLFAGVPNVKFGFAPNNGSVPDTAANSIQSYYPGDAYVDYVGVDGFNFGNPWETFDQVFGRSLSILSGYNKPIYLFSVASADGPNKAAWITDAFKVQIPKYPKIAGWIWFNENKERDWRVNSDPSSLAAFQAIVP